MDADSTQDTPLPGYYSVPIRAPLTIDSDSELDLHLPINNNSYSRTSSFNSSSSSIDISSYGDEHTSIFEAYPDEEIVIQRSHVEESLLITRPFVRYPDENYLKKSCDFGDSTVFRPFVKIPCEESSSDGFGTKLSVPMAPLTQDCDSDTDDDSVDGCRDSGWILSDGILQKVNMAPKVRSFNGDEDDELRVEGVLSGDDIIGIDNLNSVSTESVENEVVKLSESDASSLDLERIDALIALSLNNETEIVKKLSELDEPSFDSERTDAQIVPNLDSEIETENKLLESDELSFDSERIGTHIVSNSDSDIENLNSVATESVENEGCEVECFNEVVRLSESDFLSSNSEIEIVIKLSESDEPRYVSEIIDTQIVSNSDSEQEVVRQKKVQRVRAKFLRLALNEQLTTKVNGEGGNYNFDFDLTVLAIGKTGVGKSATINSIFGENKAITSAFDPGTTTVQEYTGNVDGIQLRVIDTPGLKCSSSDQSYNKKVLKSIKRFTRKHAPNVVLYVDRLDTRDVDDSHLLSLITSSLGSSVWHSCIIALTHTSCDLSRGFVVRRCRFIQEQIVSCEGYNQRVAKPVWLVDNHPSFEHDVMDLDCGLKGLVSLDQVNEDDGCDQVPPFEPLSESRDIINHSRERRSGYFTECDYRVKLFGNNHWSLWCRLCI